MKQASTLGPGRSFYLLRRRPHPFIVALFCAPFFVSAVRAVEPGIYTEYQGLRVDDEFDRVFVFAFGCVDETYKEMIADSNRSRRDGRSLKIPKCSAEETLKQLIERESHNSTGTVNYIRSKGGRCSEVEGGWNCVLTREVTTIGHAGDIVGGKLTDLFTVEISLSQEKEPISVKLTRKGVGR